MAAKVHIGSDHAGFWLKGRLTDHLRRLGHEVVDHGTGDEASTDYPDFARPVAQAVAADDQSMGVLVCSSGVGVSIAANKMPGVRAANVWMTDLAKLCRAHNNANVLCLGQSFVAEPLAISIAEVFLSTEFEGGRHARRVGKIAGLESEALK